MDPEVVSQDGGADAVESDEALLARLKRGDEDALRGLVSRYERPLFGYLVRSLGSRDDAEDVFQETFLRLVKHLHRFEEGRRVKPWLYAIASNLVKNVYRSRRGDRERTSIDAEPDEGDALAARLAALGAAPGDEASSREQAAVVRAAVATLSPTGRDALVLFYFQGLAYEEIARALEVPLGTVKSRIHNALAKLAAALGATPEVRRG